MTDRSNQMKRMQFILGTMAVPALSLAKGDNAPSAWPKGKEPKHLTMRRHPKGHYEITHYWSEESDGWVEI